MQNCDIPKYSLSRIYVYATTCSLLILLGYYYHRYLKYFSEHPANEFSFFSLAIFLISVISLILLFFRVKVKQKASFLLIFIILTSSTIFSYSFINPVDCPDCNNFVLTGERVQEQGLVAFLKNYQKPVLYKIKTEPRLYEKFLDYNKKLGSIYKNTLDDIEGEHQDITLSDNRFGTKGITIATSNYSPLWYCLTGLWIVFAGESYYSQIILPSILFAFLFLISLYFLLGLFYGKDEYRNKLSILFIVLFMPVFLQQSVQNTSTMLLGTTVSWMFFFMLKSRETSTDLHHLSAGFLYSIAVLLKFTALTLMLPIGLFYLIRFKSKAISKLLVFSLSFTALPLLLYIMFDYDMVLNIITGSTMEFSILADKGLSAQVIFWQVFYQMYLLGIPVLFLFGTHMIKVRKYLSQNERLTSYIFTAFFLMLFYILWRSGIARHWLGFLPLMVPLSVYVFENCKEKSKMILLTSVFLLANNLLLLIHDGIIMANYYHTHFQQRYWHF